jgi:hypothetical protein
LAHHADEVRRFDTLRMTFRLNEDLTWRAVSRQHDGQPNYAFAANNCYSVWLWESVAIATTEAMPLSRK